ncbi:MAG TPA: hypothetical protein VMU42_10570 [Candidatus Sulfotelmatobacter sp.]|nr:hypothetical protein [Candidatus Sulfotelmatobacter sp.]
MPCRRKESSFSEEKEAKRLLSVWCEAGGGIVPPTKEARNFLLPLKKAA